jgi:tryptophanyl-tRNA synthetase
MGDYPRLLLTRWDQGAGKIPELKVYGPPPIKDVTRALFEPGGAFWPDLVARTEHMCSVSIYHARGGVGERKKPVPEVTELSWLLSTVCAMGLLQRAVSFKDKIEQGFEPKVGLFTYPVLMAADILAYDSTTVPVGQDQVQHLEITRDLVTAFHAIYGEVFVRPEPLLGEAPLVPGLDGLKMSKSYGNTIPLMAAGKALKERINRIVTDSTPLEDPKDPEPRVAFKLYSLFATPEERAVMADKYRAGGFGDGHAKVELRAKIEEVFADARTRRAHLDAHPDEVEDVLREGARQAREVARATLDRARRAVGLA